ncbi:hypothetical protein POTOM_027702 [Populus tomentosa]|uniref:P-type ATPase N-terminal domain-containing protein n=1 Tax=Populus tomentosa TaxID=118781 RepID=A0A8X7ZC34_POPTO|nr:hypothetical protein POTOM_027702 [Populus tomentosa]
MTKSTKLKRFVYINDAESQPTQDSFCDNRISNRKYTPLNFLPKNLMEQFSSFTILQNLAIWGNLIAFYVINWIVSVIPSAGMYTIISLGNGDMTALVFQSAASPKSGLQRENHFPISVQLCCLLADQGLESGILNVAAGMVRILAIKYFRYTYAPSKINTLQQAERLGGPILSLGNIERQQRVILKDVAPVSITQSKNINPVYEPLLSDSPSSRRLLGSGTPFDFFQSQSRLSSIYSRNWKDN